MKKKVKTSKTQKQMKMFLQLPAISNDTKHLRLFQ